MYCRDFWRETEALNIDIVRHVLIQMYLNEHSHLCILFRLALV